MSSNRLIKKSLILFVITILIIISGCCALSGLGSIHGYHLNAQFMPTNDSIMVYQANFSGIEDPLPDYHNLAHTKVQNEQDAINVANNYLKSNNVMPVDVANAYAGPEYISTPLPNGTQTGSIDFWDVVYDRQINGLNVYGSNHLYFWVDTNGQITGAQKSWPVISPYQMEKLKPVNQAFSELVNYNSSVLTRPKSTPDGVVITNVTLGYYVGDPFDGLHQYVVPVYVFKGDEVYYLPSRNDSFYALVKAIQ